MRQCCSGRTPFKGQAKGAVMTMSATFRPALLAAASVSPDNGSECYKTWAGPRERAPHRRRRVAQRSGDLGVGHLPAAGPVVEPGTVAIPRLDARRSQLELH